MASRHSPRCATLMPNSTWAFASRLTSAHDGETDVKTTAAASNATRAFMGFCAHYVTRHVPLQGIWRVESGLDGARHVPRARPENTPHSSDSSSEDLRNTVNRVLVHI